jgi:CheY-like chemotaxis protein
MRLRYVLRKRKNMTPKKHGMKEAVEGKGPVLFVDDDVMYLTLVQFALRGEGITAEYASCGQDALDILKKGHCKLVFTDLHMPGGMNGYALALQARELAPDITIVMTTAESFAAPPQQALASGVCKVITKPFSPKDIREILRPYLV